MRNKLLSEAIKKISHTDYAFDYFGESVQWRIIQTQSDMDFSFSILCGHRLFHQYFPSGEAKISELFRRSKDARLERSERVFFQNMIDSCDIV